MYFPSIKIVKLPLEKLHDCSLSVLCLLKQPGANKLVSKYFHCYRSFNAILKNTSEELECFICVRYELLVES
jgi:hypothetical protein